MWWQRCAPCPRAGVRAALAQSAVHVLQQVQRQAQAQAEGDVPVTSNDEARPASPFACAVGHTVAKRLQRGEWGGMGPKARGEANAILLTDAS